MHDADRDARREHALLQSARHDDLAVPDLRRGVDEVDRERAAGAVTLGHPDVAGAAEAHAHVEARVGEQQHHRPTTGDLHDAPDEALLGHDRHVLTDPGAGALVEDDGELEVRR